MRSTLLLMLAAVPAAAVTLDPYRVPESMDLAAAARVAHAAVGSDSRTNLYLLADRAERLDRKVTETSTGIENIGLLVEFLAGTDYGPKQMPEHLINFMDELSQETETLGRLFEDVKGALETKPSESGRFAAEALKSRALALRTHLEAQRAFAHTLCEGIKKHRAVFGDASFAAAKKIAHETTPALTEVGESLLAAADQLLQKAK